MCSSGPSCAGQISMSLTDLMWLATAAYGLHVLEEYQLNWRDWARAVIGLPVEWSDFYVVNALVIVLGIVAANLARTAPGLALGFPALMLINATFFHVLPTLRSNGRFSPGLFTAVALFYPIGIACYWRAAADGHLNLRTVIGSLVLGALLMASPIVLLKIKGRPYFRQDG
jgi:uncharacterized protein with HXXEE motif